MKTTWVIGSMGLAIGLIALSSCAKSRTDGGTDSTTHWLMSCADDGDCGDLTCLCGVCSASCERDAECSVFGARATCAAPAPACDSVEQMCVAECSGNADCAGLPTSQCSAGRCATEDSEPTAMPQQDAGAAGSAGSGTGEAGTSGGANVGSAGATVPSCGRPWYRCPEVCPWQLILRGGTRTLGSCEGDCFLSLNIAPAIVLDEGSCDSVLVELMVPHADGTTGLHNATLTAEAWEHATQLSIGLSSTRMDVEPVTGCPNCTDQDNATLVLTGIDQLTQTFAYPYMDPPEALRDAHNFVQELIDQLLACEGPWIEYCSVTETSVDVGTPAACEFVYAVDASPGATMTACALEAGVEAPCRAAVTCLCSGGETLSPGPTPGVEGCVDWWLTAGRDAITFGAFCSQGPDAATRSLTEALHGFAQAWGASLSSSAGCEGLSAYY